jgi:hypothetical protein
MAASSQSGTYNTKMYTKHRHMHNVLLLFFFEQNNFTSSFNSILMMSDIQLKNILFDCIHYSHTLKPHFLNCMCYMA